MAASRKELQAWSGKYFVGVDVGTGSIRAALVDQSGSILTTNEQALQQWTPLPNFFEQSSDNIWEQTCKAIKIITLGIDVKQIAGIGFDATCSLVTLNEQFQPLSISPSGDNQQNIIMWMDHRAGKQADFINASGHRVLRYVGGSISLEQEPPKLLWLKENLYDKCWKRAGHFMDLADFLTWRATGSLSRSLCTLVCKWTYQADQDSHGWDDSFFHQIGLEDLIENNYSKIGKEVLCPGTPVGKGLSAAAAHQLGLREGTPVATSLIDAHAGGLGMLAADGSSQGISTPSLTSRLALICGTSSCHLAVSKTPVFVPGVWGPYYSAMIPQLWLSEAGQSATGKLLDHLVQNHPAFSEAEACAKKKGTNVYSYLNEMCLSVAAADGCNWPALLATDLHIWPDFHGNRSPFADATLKGMMCGLTLSNGIKDLAVLYIATVQALALGTRHIIDTLERSGYAIDVLFVCGGLGKNPLFLQINADATGLPVIMPKESESVLLGAAILGACASGSFQTIQDAMGSMCGAGKVIKPDERLKSFYDNKYTVFLKMVQNQKDYHSVMHS